MWTCRQIRRFLEHVRTRLSKCNHPGQITFLVSLQLLLFFFQNFVFSITQPGWESQAQLFGKTTHAMPGRYLQSSCSLTGIVHLDLLNCGEAVDRLKDCFLPLPFHTSAWIDMGSQLSLDAPFLGCIQDRYRRWWPMSSFIPLFHNEMIKTSSIDREKKVLDTVS